MKTSAQKIIERIAALPPEDQEAVETAVLESIDRLEELKASLARSDEDISAGRVAPSEVVFERLFARYAS